MFHPPMARLSGGSVIVSEVQPYNSNRDSPRLRQRFICIPPCAPAETLCPCYGAIVNERNLTCSGIHTTHHFLIERHIHVKDPAGVELIELIAAAYGVYLYIWNQVSIFISETVLVWGLGGAVNREAVL